MLIYIYLFLIKIARTVKIKTAFSIFVLRSAGRQRRRRGWRETRTRGLTEGVGGLGDGRPCVVVRLK